jgi:hypothetical protein
VIEPNAREACVSGCVTAIAGSWPQVAEINLELGLDSNVHSSLGSPCWDGTFQTRNGGQRLGDGVRRRGGSNWPSTVKEFALWNPADLGYLAAYATKALISGEIKGDDGDTFKAGKLGEYTVKDKTVLLGDPFKFNKDNIDQFKF